MNGTGVAFSFTGTVAAYAADTGAMYSTKVTAGRINAFSQRTGEPAVRPIPCAHGRLGRSHSIISEFSVWRSESVLWRACCGAWLLPRTGLAPARVARLVQPWVALASPLCASHPAALGPTGSLSSRQPVRQLAQQFVAEHSFQRHQARRLLDQQIVAEHTALRGGLVHKLLRG